MSGINESEGGGADSIYLNGDILTMSGDAPVYVAVVATLGNKIVFVGDEDEALKRSKKESRFTSRRETESAWLQLE